MLEVQVEIITYKYGNTYPIKLGLTDESGAAVDITGNTFTLDVYPTQSAVVADKLFNVTGSIVSASGGTFQFAMTTTESNNEGDYYYEVTMNDGSDKTILEGPFNINKKIFKR